MTETTTEPSLPVAAPTRTMIADAGDRASNHARNHGGAAAIGAETIRNSFADGFAVARAWLRRMFLRRMSRTMFRSMITLGWIAVIALAATSRSRR